MNEVAGSALKQSYPAMDESQSLHAKRFQALVSAHSAIVWTADANGAFVEHQPGWESYTGQPWNEYRGRGGFERVHIEDRQRAQEAWVAAVERRSSYEVNIRIWNAASQSWRWCASRAVPVLDDAGHVLEWIGTLVDVDTRLRAELTVRENERRFRSILERVQAVGLMLDKSGRVTFANDFLLELTSWTRDEVIGHDYFDRFIRGTSDIQQRFRAAIGSGDIFPHAENEIVARDGTRHMIAWDNTVLRDADGNLVGVASIGRDVTQQQQLLDTLRRSEEGLRTLVDAMPQLVWSTTPDGDCNYLSKQWLEYTGQTESEGMGYGWVTAIHPEERLAIERRWRDFIAGRGAYDTEYRLRRHDGTYRWFKVRGAALCAPEGRILSIYGTSTDIHDQKTAEEALRKSQESLRVALTASGTGTFRWDPRTGEFLEFGENLRSLFGLAPHESLRTTEDFLAKVHQDDVDAVIKSVENCRNGGDFDLEYRVVLPNNEIRWLYDRGRMVKDAAGNSLYLVGACTDITLRKRAEQALLRSEKLSAAASIAATLAHEINNPLEGVLNLVYLARQLHYTDRERAEMLEAAELEITRASELAKRSLSFYRTTQAGRTESLQRVLDSVLYIYGQKLHQQRVELDKRYLVDKAIEVPESDLRQIFYNLVSNAVDAMPSGGKLVVKLSSVGNGLNKSYVRVTVADTGAGIDPADRQRLFRPFFTTKADTGTGLGLWVTREIIERHGGTIRQRTISEVERHGTVFSVLLPLPV